MKFKNYSKHQCVRWHAHQLNTEHITHTHCGASAHVHSAFVCLFLSLCLTIAEHVYVRLSSKFQKKFSLKSNQNYAHTEGTRCMWVWLRLRVMRTAQRSSRFRRHVNFKTSQSTLEKSICKWFQYMNSVWLWVWVSGSAHTLAKQGTASVLTLHFFLVVWEHVHIARFSCVFEIQMWLLVGRVCAHSYGFTHSHMI